MEVIISQDNKLIKRANKLKNKKFRSFYGEYLIEGLRGVIDTPDELIKVIFVAESFEDSRLNKDKLVYVSDKLIDKLGDTESGPKVVAIAAVKPESDFELNRILYLDRIRDPGNMGTIIRTAVAAGYEVICDDCVDVYNPKVVRSCVSALAKAKLHVGNFIDKIIEKGYNIVGAVLGGKSIYECSANDKLCLVIGNEAEGIRQDIIDRCDILCTIPMEDMESLNASVSAGILMYHFKY